jgi:hypothetical protein
MAARLAVALLALLVCCARPRRIYVRPYEENARDLSGVSFLSYASSRVDGFYDRKGRSCAPFAGHVREYFAGWWADDDDPICFHGTLESGLQPAMLEMSWRGVVPADGNYDVLSAGYAIGSWGQVMARGSYFGDFWAWARVDVAVESPNCRGSRSFNLARAAISLLAERTADFSGWVQVPDIWVAGCKGGDPLEVRVQLVGQSNRGHIAVDGFGFWAAKDEELNQMFGIRSAPAPTAGATTSNKRSQDAANEWSRTVESSRPIPQIKRQGAPGGPR